MHISVIKWIITILVLLILGYIAYKKRKKKKELITFFVSLLIAVLIAEVSVRQFFPQKMDIKTIFQRDAEFGWSFYPGRESTISYAELGPHQMQTNSDGFRDSEFDFSKKNSILVMGDSYVSNIGVANEEVFTEILEEELTDTEIMNFGVNGYGPLQSYRLLQNWLSKTTPDRVLFFIYLRNDYTDNVETSWLLPRPTAELNADKSDLIINPIPSEYIEDSRPLSLYTYSHLYVLYDRLLHQLFPKADPNAPMPSMK